MTGPPVPILRIEGWHPTLTNAMLWKHWATVRDLKRADAQRLLVECQNQGIPKALGRRRLSVEWVMGPRNKQPDQDNIWKSLLDGLVHAGRLKDDSPTWCELAPPTFTRGPVKGIVVAFEEV